MMTPPVTSRMMMLVVVLLFPHKMGLIPRVYELLIGHCITNQASYWLDRPPCVSSPVINVGPGLSADCFRTSCAARPSEADDRGQRIILMTSINERVMSNDDPQCHE